jgi:hypothetical protein
MKQNVISLDPVQVAKLKKVCATNGIKDTNQDVVNLAMDISLSVLETTTIEEFYSLTNLNKPHK